MVIEIDGSMGEGGGQILRVALALSAVTGKPVKIFNIRAKRRNPGLQNQHLTAVRALVTLTNARVEGAVLRSTQLLFEPRGIRSGSFRFDVGTAGSVTLVLQSLIPVLPFAPGPVEVEIRGGTDVPWSPPVDYVRLVLIPLLREMGLELDLRVIRRGHYPRGGGIVRVAVRNPPGMLRPVDKVERGALRRIVGVSHAVRLPRHVAERQARSAEEVLRAANLGVPIDIDLEYYEKGRDPHLGPGSGVVLTALAERSVLGADALGARGKPAEEVGREAAEKLLEELRSGAALDRHAGDMLIPLAALARGRSCLRASSLTMHALTMIKLVELVLGARVELLEGGEKGRPYTVSVEGIGLTRG